MKDRTRAIRRYHIARLKKKRSHYWGYGKYGWRSFCEISHIEMDPATASAIVQHPAICSCYMCGNPRRWWAGPEKITIQERKSDEKFKYEIGEYYSCVDDSIM